METNRGRYDRVLRRNAKLDHLGVDKQATLVIGVQCTNLKAPNVVGRTKEPRFEGTQLDCLARTRNFQLCCYGGRTPVFYSCGNSVLGVLSGFRFSERTTWRGGGSARPQGDPDSHAMGGPRSKPHAGALY